jgi:hypothetical protein
MLIKVARPVAVERILMFQFLLILLAIWVVLIIIGFIVHALLWLAVVAIVLFFLTALFGAFSRGRSSR